MVRKEGLMERQIDWEGLMVGLKEGLLRPVRSEHPEGLVSNCSGTFQVLAA